MQTRSGTRHQFPETGPVENPRRKKPRPAVPAVDPFGVLPDDLVISILCKLSSSARRASDLLSVLMTCKRLKELGLDPLVLSIASPDAVAIRATNWSDEAHRFLKMCVNAGNIEACYILGMIRFYCLGLRRSGASLMARAAVNAHGGALYSLAIIQFNGSGGSRADKDPQAGVALLVRSASVGHAGALRELGHCLVDGYGVRRIPAEGRGFLLQAQAKEISKPPSHCDAACAFLLDWFGSRRTAGSELRLCSHPGCGRPETRKYEFRRCSACGKVNYCSRACQAIHWKLGHRAECALAEQQQMMEEDGEVAGDDDGNEVED